MQLYLKLGSLLFTRKSSFFVNSVLSPVSLFCSCKILSAKKSCWWRYTPNDMLIFIYSSYCMVCTLFAFSVQSTKKYFSRRLQFLCISMLILGTSLCLLRTDLVVITQWSLFSLTPSFTRIFFRNWHQWKWNNYVKDSQECECREYLEEFFYKWLWGIFLNEIFCLPRFCRNIFFIFR